MWVDVVWPKLWGGYMRFAQYYIRDCGAYIKEEQERKDKTEKEQIQESPAKKSRVVEPDMPPPETPDEIPPSTGVIPPMFNTSTKPTAKASTRSSRVFQLRSTSHIRRVTQKQYIPLTYHIIPLIYSLHIAYTHVSVYTTYIPLIYCLYTAYILLRPSLPVQKNVFSPSPLYQCHWSPSFGEYLAEILWNPSLKRKTKELIHFFLRFPLGTPNTRTLEDEEFDPENLFDDDVGKTKV